MVRGLHSLMPYMNIPRVPLFWILRTQYESTTPLEPPLFACNYPLPDLTTGVNNKD